MEFDVALTKQHLEALGRTQPLTGMIELVWNALDADATEIRVEFARNEIDGVEEIRVRDNGHGILAREAEEFFGALGGSWKRTRGSHEAGARFTDVTDADGIEPQALETGSSGNRSQPSMKQTDATCSH